MLKDLCRHVYLGQDSGQQTTADTVSVSLRKKKVKQTESAYKDKQSCKD